MKLWTEHTPGFSITSGEVDWSRSEYYNETTGIKEAYHRLAEWLQTRQYIWCYVIEPKRCLDGREMWPLDVPQDNFFKIVDSYVWNKVIGNDKEVGPPIRLIHTWKAEACRELVNVNDYLTAKTLEYHSQGEPPEGWRDVLFVEDINPLDERTVLLRHPVSEQFVTQWPPSFRK